MSRIALLALVGCGSPEERTTFHDEGGDPAVTDDTGSGPVDGLATVDIQKLACDGALPVFSVCPCDFALGWSGVTADIYGEAVDPASFEVVAWARIDGETSADVLASVCEGDDLSSHDVHDYVDVAVAGLTATHLSEMSFFGTGPAIPKPGQTFWLWLADTRQPGFGVRVIALADIVDGGSDSIEIAWP